MLDRDIIRLESHVTKRKGVFHYHLIVSKGIIQKTIVILNPKDLRRCNLPDEIKEVVRENLLLGSYVVICEEK